jgi:hypothetical protein
MHHLVGISPVVSPSEIAAAFLYAPAFSVTEIAPKPACGQHWFRSHDIRAVSSTDLNNLHATWFGNCLAQWNIAVSADSGHDVALNMREALCRDFGFRTQVECVLPRAALPQPPQFRGFPTVKPVASTRVNGDGNEREPKCDDYFL